MYIELYEISFMEVQIFLNIDSCYYHQSFCNKNGKWQSSPPLYNCYQSLIQINLVTFNMRNNSENVTFSLIGKICYHFMLIQMLGMLLYQVCVSMLGFLFHLFFQVCLFAFLSFCHQSFITCCCKKFLKRTKPCVVSILKSSCSNG